MSTRATPPEQMLARILGDVSSATLTLDPLSRARLAALAGHRVQLSILPPGSRTPRPLTVHVHEDGLTCDAGADELPHVILTGTLPDIARRLLGIGGGTGVRIEGDETVLTGLAELFTRLQPDLAAPLSGLIGRELADSVVGLAEAGAAFLRSATEGVSAAARREAAGAFVDQSGFEQLLSRLEALRLRVDRLDARTQHLEAAPEGARDAP